MDELTNKRIQGKIFSINEKKGYGFITSLELEFEKIYFYWSNLVNGISFKTDLKKGTLVEFDLVWVEAKEGRPAGWNAFRIDLVRDPVSSIPEAKVERIK